MVQVEVEAGPPLGRGEGKGADTLLRMPVSSYGLGCWAPLRTRRPWPAPVPVPCAAARVLVVLLRCQGALCDEFGGA